jgi:diguanylate cyclase (GGDEF)-like protein
MRYVSGVRVTAAVVLLGITVLAISLIEYQQAKLTQLTQEQLLLDAHRELAIIRSSLEADIYSDIFYANSLATLVSVNPASTTQQWQGIAKELFRKAKNLRNLGMAPDDVIRFVYPTDGNEAAIGLDFRTIPSQYRTVKRAREMQSIFLAGPVNLVQGGVGLIARTPIFTDPPVNSEYWGTCSVVIDMEGLFHDAGVYELQEKYVFAIRGKDGKGERGEVFWGSPEVFDSHYASERVRLPSGHWQMAIELGSMYQVLPWYQRYASRLVGYPLFLFLVLIFGVIYYLYHVARQHALQDELTHLPNRRYLIYTLEQLVGDVSRNGNSFALLNLDLDKFKSVNDTYGHDVGDKLLLEVAKRVKACLRASDVVARVGGDEFLVILPRVSDEQAVQRIVDNLQQQISAHPVVMGYATIYAEVSIGYTIYQDNSVTADDLLRLADERMYSEKKRKQAQEHEEP